jgi:hypothetical protein
VRRKARIQRLEFQDFGIFIIKGTYFNLEDVGTKKVDYGIFCKKRVEKETLEGNPLHIDTL